MKERGILFQAPLVRALLAGTKTQTRRLIKPQPIAWAANPCFWLWRDDEPLTLRHILDRSPYGASGDRLWVRETWATLTGNGIRTVYRADGEDPRTGWDDTPDDQRPAMRWRPSIFMPRSASRITLEVTEVRVQRLTEINEEDARAEGVDVPDGLTAVSAFALLWNRINGERASWTSKPWVWVVSFRRLP